MMSRNTIKPGALLVFHWWGKKIPHHECLIMHEKISLTYPGNFIGVVITKSPCGAHEIGDKVDAAFSYVDWEKSETIAPIAVSAGKSVVNILEI